MVSEAINYDLIVACSEITHGKREYDEMFSDCPIPKHLKTYSRYEEDSDDLHGSIQ